MNELRTDIPRRAADESGDAYATRLYLALRDGEVANGYRRLGDALQHVGDALEFLLYFDDTPVLEC